MNKEFDTAQTLRVFQMIDELLEAGSFPASHEACLTEVRTYVSAGMDALSQELMMHERKGSTLQ